MTIILNIFNSRNPGPTKNKGAETVRLESPNQNPIGIHIKITEFCRLNRLQNQPQTKAK